MAGPKFVGKIEWPTTIQLGKGLEGAITGETTIGYVDGEKGWLVYRGYNIFDLAEHSNFEETSYLLMFGKLPTKKELDDFNKKLLGYREVPDEVIETLKRIPKDVHPMAAMRTGVSVLGCFDPKADDTSVENETDIGIKLIAQMSTIAGAVARIRHGKEPLKPDPGLDHSTNFLYMMTGEKPDEFSTKVMDVSLILHADHGMNASTFTTMVTNSSLSDMYSSICAGICSLKGPLHGGANERALAEMMQIKDEDNAVKYVKDCVDNKKKIMGFGHRVYKAYDPRAKVLGQYSQKVTEMKNMANLYKIAKKVEEEVIKAYGERGIFPNVDFYSGTIYYAMGIEIPMFTPIFAVSRVSGWVARVLEYLPQNRIFRPRAVYVGPMEQKYVPMDKR
ncbi:MAG: citrate synthase/methylcitrate synthase [Candidatus Zixiibacteriota bacterium]